MAAFSLQCFPASLQEKPMADKQSRSALVEKSSPSSDGDGLLSRQRLIELLNEDLSREYQAIIGYVVYSQVLKGPQYMAIADELEIHAGEELKHAIEIARQIDYLGGMPTVKAQPVRTSERAEDMLRFDLENENETVRNYRERVQQCEALGEYAMAEHIRAILMDEQEHQIDLATALGVDVADMSQRS
jgi:bacterioferritin